MGRDFIYPQMTQITQIFFGAQHTLLAEKKEVQNGKGFAHSEGYFFTTKTTKNTEQKPNETNFTVGKRPQGTLICANLRNLRIIPSEVANG